MQRNFKTYLTGQIAESLVVAELGRRDIVATSFSGNVPDIDLLAHKHGKNAHIQVKGIREGNISFRADRFLIIRQEGVRQFVDVIDTELDPNLVFVCVSVGRKIGEDRFFVFRQINLQQTILQGYNDYLESHGGVRPRNPMTLHTAVSLNQLAVYEDNWSLVDEALK